LHGRATRTLTASTIADHAPLADVNDEAAPSVNEKCRVQRKLRERAARGDAVKFHAPLAATLHQGLDDRKRQGIRAQIKVQQVASFVSTVGQQSPSCAEFDI